VNQRGYRRSGKILYAPHHPSI